MRCLTVGAASGADVGGTKGCAGAIEFGHERLLDVAALRLESGSAGGKVRKRGLARLSQLNGYSGYFEGLR
jgi:hypothetical protein